MRSCRGAEPPARTTWRVGIHLWLATFGNVARDAFEKENPRMRFAAASAPVFAISVEKDQTKLRDRPPGSKGWKLLPPEVAEHVGVA